MMSTVKKRDLTFVHDTPVSDMNRTGGEVRVENGIPI